MAESNQQPPLCPCGFFGSPTTAGLCSKCYKAKLQREEVAEAKMQSGISDATETSKSTHVAISISSDKSMIEKNGKCGIDMRVEQPDESTATGMDSATAAEMLESEIVERPVQKNKKRCFKCNQRLELAFTEIGRCKCDYIFCEQHRLPEQHDCVYDHKEKGRREALDKMISPKKHIGTSLRRLDSDS